MTNIAIIDNQVLFREGLKSILETNKSFKVIAEGDSEKDITSIYDEFTPDLLIVGMSTPDLNYIDRIMDLKYKNPEARVAILTTIKDDDFVFKAISTGVRGYLLKEMNSRTIYEALKTILSGGSYLHHKITGIFVRELHRLEDLEYKKNHYKIDFRIPFHLLTKRECEVLQSLADGKSNRAISETLFITETTVKNHVSRVLTKLKVNDRTQAVVTAIKNGWVEIP